MATCNNRSAYVCPVSQSSMAPAVPSSEVLCISEPVVPSSEVLCISEPIVPSSEVLCLSDEI
jgi:hypothetical protein